MKKLADHITAYRAVPFDSKGEACGKVRVLERLEDHLGDPDVLAFLLSILGDTGEYDMARCHLLKWFECDPASDAESHRRIGECIADTLRREDDWMVKCWLARVAGVYSDVPAIVTVAAERFRDSAESDDVRCGVQRGLEGLGPTAEILELFHAVAAGTDTIAEYARDTLNRWGQSEPDAPTHPQSI